MKISECFKRGFTKIRLPWWDDEAYIELYVTPDGKYYGPWATIHDPHGEAGIRASGEEPIKEWPIIMDTSDKWEPFENE